MRDESTIDTPMLSRSERFALSVTTFRAILRRVGRIHLDYLTASFFRFARQDQNELIPSCVADALRKMMILHHPFNVQIFDRNRIKLSHDLERRLVVKIRALSPDFLMFLLQQIDRLASVIASLVHSARDFALSSLQFTFGLAQKFRILDYFTSRECGEVLDPDINPYRLAGLGEESGLVLLNSKDRIPAISLSLNRTGLDGSFNWTGETKAARANLRQLKLVAFKPKPALWVSEGIEARGRFESRIAGRFSVLATPEEGVKGFIHSAQGVLKNLAMNLAHILTKLLDLRELDGLGVVVNRKPVDAVSVSPLLQRRVVEFAANVQCGAARGFKLRIEFHLVFVGLHFPDYTLVTMANQ
jgi:hypothetical protein